MVVVSPYDAEWPARATSVITDLRGALGAYARRIEHIGSTAIPGMPAKDIIDLQVSVHDLDGAAVAFDGPLRALGFERKPYDRDHVPAGCDDDPTRWAKRYWRRRDPARGDVNLHVRVAGSPNERLALLFRDWMRAHPEAIAPYAAIKYSLAEAVPDIGVYTGLKDPIVDLVVVAAEEWATASDWSPSGGG